MNPGQGGRKVITPPAQEGADLVLNFNLYWQKLIYLACATYETIKVNE